MFGIGTPELIVIGLIILIFYGPDRLPGVLAKVNHFFKDIKMMGSDVQRDVRRELHRIETEVTQLEQASHLQEENKEENKKPKKTDEPE